MTPNVVLFQPTGPLGLTQRQRTEAANWAARMGLGWSADPMLADDGRMHLLIATPRDEAEDGVSWQVERTPLGFEVFDAWTMERLALCLTLGAALRAVEEVEEEHSGGMAANDR